MIGGHTKIDDDHKHHLYHSSNDKNDVDINHDIMHSLMYQERIV